MTSYLYPDNELKLVEGNSYIFKVLKLITLQDSEQYLIVEDPFNLRHFIPAKPYEKYGIQIGSEINCYVDHINCTGRVFLEPDHPVYRIGEKYTFRITGILSSQNKDIKLKTSDCFGNNLEIVVPETAFLQNKKEIICAVKRIKRGIPDLNILNGK